jgi:hypothetical protein
MFDDIRQFSQDRLFRNCDPSIAGFSWHKTQQPVFGVLITECHNIAAPDA